MRIIESDDRSLLPTDLVREQDFIMKLRQMQRNNTPYSLLLFAFSEVEGLTVGKGAMERIHEHLNEFAKRTKGGIADMSNGDIFLFWGGNPDIGMLTAQAENMILSDVPFGTPLHENIASFAMPQDYTTLRQRMDNYIEEIRAQTVSRPSASPTAAEALRSSAARGPLTAWSVDQIGRLLGDLDLALYTRMQPIYRFTEHSLWTPFTTEYFVSFDALKKDCFPNLELITPEHLFLALCEMLDQKLLAIMTADYDLIAEKSVHLNLSVATIMSSVFAQFVHRVPRAARMMIGFELHRGDLFQDLSQTLGAIEILKREGFRVILDGIMPAMTTYVNFASFDFDFIKINISKERAHQLLDPNIRHAIAQMKNDKIIFYRCDSEQALKTGQSMGVTRFQGWLMDKLNQKSDDQQSHSE